MSGSVQDDLVKCPACGGANPLNKRFCGDCGTSLDPVLNSVRTYLDANLGAKLESLVKERFRDQHVIEIEAAANAAEKVMGWTKILGSVFGIFAAIVLGVFGFLGYHGLSDFRMHIAETTKLAKDAINQDAMEGAKEVEQSKMRLNANKLAEEKVADQLKNNLITAQSDSAVASNIGVRLTALQAKVVEQQAQLQNQNGRIDEQQRKVEALTRTIGADSFAQVNRAHQAYGVNAAGIVDWKALNAVGVTFAYILGSVGGEGDVLNPGKDYNFETNWLAAKDAGVLRGAVHYWTRRYLYSGAEQAQQFSSIIKRVPAGELPPAVFFGEDNSMVTRRGIDDDLNEFAQFLHDVEVQTGCRPVVYAGSFWKENVHGQVSVKDIVKYPLALQQFGQTPAVLSPWKDWTFWQFTDGLRLGALPSYPFTAFHGTAMDLKAFSKASCSLQPNPNAALH